MKKAISLILVIATLLCLASCGPTYKCTECGKDYEYQPSRYSTKPYCLDCHNQKPDSVKYCTCGNRADTSRGSANLCTDCWNNVEKAVQNALG